MLSERLKLIASLIGKGERVADIGTDHAYLPIHLRQNGISERVIASDIGEKPLMSAKRNIEDCGCDGIETRLCDGLLGIYPDEVDTVVIAGMGGECIAGILENCSWAKNSGKRFICQPMNSPEELRRALLGDYTLLSEQAVFDGGRVYTVMEYVARPDNEKRDFQYLYTGLLDPKKECDLLFLQKQHVRMTECAAPLKNCERERGKYEMLLLAAKAISDRINK